MLGPATLRACDSVSVSLTRASAEGLASTRSRPLGTIIFIYAPWLCYLHLRRGLLATTFGTVKVFEDLVSRHDLVIDQYTRDTLDIIGIGLRINIHDLKDVFQE